MQGGISDNHEFDTPQDEQLSNAVRGMKDLLASVTKAKQENQYEYSLATPAALPVPPAAPSSVPEPDDAPKPIKFISMLNESARAVSEVGRHEPKNPAHDIQVMQDQVRAELWGELVSIDLLNKQVDKNLGLYSDLFEDWHAQKALKRTIERLVASKCIRAWRQWARFRLSPKVKGYGQMDQRRFLWWRYADGGGRLMDVLLGNLFSRLLPRCTVFQVWKTRAAVLGRIANFAEKRRKREETKYYRLMFTSWLHHVHMEKFFRVKYMMRFFSRWFDQLLRKRFVRSVFLGRAFNSLPIARSMAFDLWFQNAEVVSKGRALLRRVHRRWKREIYLAWKIYMHMEQFVRFKKQQRFYRTWLHFTHSRIRVRLLLSLDVFKKLPFVRAQAWHRWKYLCVWISHFEAFVLGPVGRKLPLKKTHAFHQLKLVMEWNRQCATFLRGATWNRLPVRKVQAFDAWLESTHHLRDIDAFYKNVRMRELAKRFRLMRLYTVFSRRCKNRFLLRFYRRWGNAVRMLCAARMLVRHAFKVLGRAWRKARMGVAFLEHWQDDRTCLENLYRKAGGEVWHRSQQWNSIQDISTWQGVETELVHGRSRVVRLLLPGNGLVGRLPDSMGQLVYVRELWLDENRLTGPIPWRLGQCEMLTLIGLATNNLIMNVPKALGQLFRLQYLELQYNHLDGRIPPDLGDLRSLRRLNLGSNGFHGKITPELAQLRNLEELIIFNTYLDGTVPAALRQLQAAKIITLYDNHLTGELPAGIGKLPHLRRLELQRNFFQGPLPDEMATLNEVYYHGQGTIIGLRNKQRLAQQHMEANEKRKMEIGILDTDEQEPDRGCFFPPCSLNDPNQRAYHDKQQK